MSRARRRVGASAAGARAVEDEGRPSGADGCAARLQPADQRLKTGVRAVVEGEIIPLLRSAHRSDGQPPARSDALRAPPTEAAIAELARLAACCDLSETLSFVEARCREGLPLEAALLDLIAPAAQLLGEQWKQDLRAFHEVTFGLGTLQQVVHILGPRFAPALPDRGLVVLAAPPGETQPLELQVLGEFMRRAGWGVHVEAAMSEQSLLELIRENHVVMLGFTAGAQAREELLAELIASVRRHSLNPGIEILLGGSSGLGALAARLGATLHASDPRQAVELLERRSRPCSRRIPADDRVAIELG